MRVYEFVAAVRFVAAAAAFALRRAVVMSALVGSVVVVMALGRRVVVQLAFEVKLYGFVDGAADARYELDARRGEDVLRAAADAAAD